MLTLFNGILPLRLLMLTSELCTVQAPDSLTDLLAAQVQALKLHGFMKTEN